MRGFWTLGVLAALALAGCGGGSSEAEEPAAPAGYRFVQVASGFESPVHVTAPRNQRGRLYVVEQEGRIRIVQNGRITGTLLDIRSQVQCCGEQGLLSVAFHPRYARNGKYYVNYTDNRGDTRVVEYRGKRRLRQRLLRRAAVLEPQRRPERVRPRRAASTSASGDGGAGGDPENRAQNLGSRLGKTARGQRRPPRTAAADRRLRPAEPLALLVRPADRRPLHRRRRPELVGGSELHSPPQPRGRELRLGRLRGPRALREQAAERERAAGLPRRRLSAWRRPLRGQRRLRLSRVGSALGGRPVLLRRQLLRDRVELPGGARAERQARAVHPRRRSRRSARTPRASSTPSRSTAASTSCARASRRDGAAEPAAPTGPTPRTRASAATR